VLGLRQRDGQALDEGSVGAVHPLVNQCCIAAEEVNTDLLRGPVERLSHLDKALHAVARGNNRYGADGEAAVHDRYAVAG